MNIKSYRYVDINTYQDLLSIAEITKDNILYVIYCSNCELSTCDNINDAIEYINHDIQLCEGRTSASEYRVYASVYSDSTRKCYAYELSFNELRGLR